MSRFKRIKKKSNKKSSISIDEKIDALNKELKKNWNVVGKNDNS